MKPLGLADRLTLRNQMVLHSYKPYKARRIDDILPVLLQKALQIRPGP